MVLSKVIESAEAMETFGEQLAQQLPVGTVIYLAGELGSGKTTLVRGILHGLGYTGHVKSPTFTLVEPYDIDNINIYHFDLYRITDPDELEYVGLRDYFAPDAICLLEWPERGGDRLPVPDLSVQITYQGPARALELMARSDTGRGVLTRMS